MIEKRGIGGAAQKGDGDSEGQSESAGLCGEQF
jgi:hypothetical protein